MINTQQQEANPKKLEIIYVTPRLGMSFVFSVWYDTRQRCLFTDITHNGRQWLNIPIFMWELDQHNDKLGFHFVEEVRDALNLKYIDKDGVEKIARCINSPVTKEQYDKIKELHPDAVKFGYWKLDKVG